MTIRRATLEDAGALTAFGRRVFAATFASDNTPADLQSYLDHSYSDSLQREEVADPKLDTLLAEVDATLAAFAQLREGPAGDGVNGRDSIELWRFYVDPRWHGQGLARELMQAVEAAARDRGARTIWLGVWERNLRAQAFYRKHGFIVVGTQTFQLGSDAQRDLVMAKGL